MLRKGFGSVVVTLLALSIYSAIHYQLIRTLFEAHIVLINFEAVADIKPIPSKLETVDVISRPSKQKQQPSSPKKQVCDLELHLAAPISGGASTIDDLMLFLSPISL